MDAMAFGMGCCCLQVTFQARDIREARDIYDQLAVFTPLLMALSGASPVYLGMLADRDCRWNVIASSVDDRTAGERGVGVLAEGEQRLPKSRYGSISSFIGLAGALRDEYNNLPLPVDASVKATLTAEGIDERLATHIAHLWTRDPLVIVDSLVESVSDTSSSIHFENIQSTNWQTMRFKPPPPTGSLGWRVEFRPMEVQWTDFENAAYATFVVLLSRCVFATCAFCIQHATCPMHTHVYLC
jgi:glutamate--cysteine ligase catalytic subunit